MFKRALVITAIFCISNIIFTTSNAQPGTSKTDRQQRAQNVSLLFTNPKISFMIETRRYVVD